MSRSEPGRPNLSNSLSLDRRAWVRFDSELEAACKPSGALKDAGWAGTVVNISAGGVAVVLRHRFRVGTPLVVEIKSRSGKLMRAIQVRVRHVRVDTRQSVCQWMLGCQFVTPLSDREVEELLA